MKKFLPLILLFWALGLVSCQKALNDSPSWVMIGASLAEDESAPSADDASSKVGASDKADGSGLSLSWKSSDQLKIIGQTSQVYTLSSIQGKKAFFTGKEVQGSQFDIILSESGDYLTRSYVGQVQNGVSSTAHLQYDACLKGVRSYKNLYFTDSWASNQGGQLLQSGCLLLHFQMPISGATVTKVTLKAPSAIFYTGNAANSAKNSSISLSFENGKVGANNEVKAYIMTSMQAVSIPAGTQLLLMIESDKGNYVKTFTPGAVKILPGKRNIIKINGKNWQRSHEYKQFNVLTYNVGWFHKNYSTLGHYAYPEVAKVIQHIDADFVGLNETDNNGQRSGYVYQAQELANQLGSGWSPYFAHAGYDWYGNSILGAPRQTVVKSWPRIELPLVSGSETRSMGVVEYEDVVFCITHLDHKSLTDRICGAAIINDWVNENYGDSEKLIVLVGDMNCSPSEATMTSFGLCWTIISPPKATYPSKAPASCIDYILVWKGKAEYDVLACDVLSSCPGVDLTLVSDHVPLYATIKYKKAYEVNEGVYDTPDGNLTTLPNSDIFSEF